MIEKIVEIAGAIQKHRNLELAIQASNPSIGRSKVIFDKEERIFWIVNFENTGSSVPIYDINGNVIGKTVGTPTTYTGDGIPIYKNSRLGEKLILFSSGSHGVSTPGGNRDLTILSRATFSPSIYSEVLTDIVINLADDPNSYSYRTINEILSLQREIDQTKEDFARATDEDKKEEALILLKRIEEKEKEKQSHIRKAQSFIRRYAELRYQPILDPRQESFKRSMIFDGTLIINGGPGTGKTTSLIQRIKFLTSSSISDYYELSSSQEILIKNQKTSWIFYSPSDLLALYLRNSMIKEGLEADDERVKVWARHKTELVKTYRFITDLKRPFLVFNRYQSENLFLNNSDSIKRLVQGFEDFYLVYQSSKIKKVIDLDIAGFYWEALGKAIKRYLSSRGTITNIEGLIRLYIGLNETFRDDSANISGEYSDLINKVASRVQVGLQNDAVRLEQIFNLFKQWKSEGQASDYENEENENEMEEFEESNDNSITDFERELFSKLKTLCRKQALIKYDKNIKLSQKDGDLTRIIPEVKFQIEYDRLGQASYFKKHLEPILKGLESNILREIPAIYKSFRRHQFEISNPDWDLTILEELVKMDKNKRIHSDEQAFLLYYSNTITQKLAGNFREIYNNLNHPFISGFKANCKPVIGIDEATDFSLIDILAIYSLRHPDLSSVTISGDILQRITKHGLNKWEDLIKIVPGCQRRDLKISYRQSHALLSLARTIYEKTTGQKANYKPHIERDDNEPKPLLYISQDEDDKLLWISERIAEIYKAYGESIPSIAIFLPEESMLESFSDKLGNLDVLADVGIQVQACRQGQVLGQKAAVRVFSVKHIKGLEFESVFFHNIDLLQTMDLGSDMLLRYLYVGLSRATFYLAVTTSEGLNEDFAFLHSSFDIDGKTWAL